MLRRRLTEVDDPARWLGFFSASVAFGHPVATALAVADEAYINDFPEEIVWSSGQKGIKSESYFSECPRDEGGHCKPKGQGDDSGKPNELKKESYPKAKDRDRNEGISGIQPDEWRPPGGFRGINDVDDEKVNRLAQSMSTQGWTGPPLLVIGRDLLTGTHRAAAAKKAGLDDIPVVNVKRADAEKAAQKLGLWSEEAGDFFVDDHDDWLLILKKMGDQRAVALFDHEIAKREETDDDDKPPAKKTKDLSWLTGDRGGSLVKPPLQGLQKRKKITAPKTGRGFIRENPLL